LAAARGELAAIQRHAQISAGELGAAKGESERASLELAALGAALAAERELASRTNVEAAAREAALVDRAAHAELESRGAEDRAWRSEQLLRDEQGRLADLEQQLEVVAVECENLRSQSSRRAAEYEAEQAAAQTRDAEAGAQIQQSLAALADARRQATQSQFELAPLQQKLTEEQSRTEALQRQCSLASQQVDDWRQHHESKAESWQHELDAKRAECLDLSGRLADSSRQERPRAPPTELSRELPREVLVSLERPATSPLGEPEDDEDPFDLLLGLYADSSPRKRRKSIVLAVGGMLIACAIAAAIFWENLRSFFGS
jgi:hypothetical protein